MSTNLIDYYFSRDHEWVNSSWIRPPKIGISDFAQNELGDIVFVDIDSVGKTLKANDIFGTIEAVKTVSDLYAPIDCEIVAVNNTIEMEPGLVNRDPYGTGWLVEIKPSNNEDVKNLMNHLEYQALVYGKESIEKELVHILYLDESGNTHYLPALRGDDGNIILENEHVKSIFIQSFITAENLLKQQLIEEFEYLLNKQYLKEYEFQKFFEEHPEFLLGTEYETLYPQVVLKSDYEEFRPDFILKPIAGTSIKPNIVELKLPNEKIEKLRPRREGLYANIYEAAAQLKAYSRYFDEKENRENMRKQFGFTSYRPTLTLIIGKTIEIGDEKLKESITESLSPIQLVTYTDVLLKYKNMIKKL